MKYRLLALSLPLALACGDPLPGALDVVADPSLAFVDAGAPIDPPSCGTVLVRCPGVVACIDTARDDAHCGECGLACGGDERCDVGTCAPIVEPPGPPRWRGDVHIATVDDTDRSIDPRERLAGRVTRGLQLANDAEGNALAVWPSHATVWSTRYDVTLASWGPAERVADGEVSEISMAMTADGDAFVAFRRGEHEVELVRFDGSREMWSPVEVMAEDDESALFRPLVVVNEAGAALFIWHRASAFGAAGRDWARVLDAGSETWSDPQLLDTEDTDAGGAAHADLDANGNAVVAWSKRDRDLGDAVLANRYDAETRSWSGTQRIAPSRFTTQVQVAMAPSGDAMVLYRNTLTTEGGILACRYDAAAEGWEPPTLVSAGWLWSFTMSARPDGQVTLVRDDAVRNLWGVRYDPGTRTWTELGQIASEIQSWWEVESGFRLSANAAGEAFVVWNHRANERTIFWSDAWASRYDPASGRWSEPELIESFPGGRVNLPRVVIADDGEAVAAWRLRDPDDRTMTWVNNYR